MRAQQQVIRLGCRHEYHKACILKWLKSAETPTCPQCKAPALGGAGAADDESSPPPQLLPSPRETSPDDEPQEWWPHT